MDALEVALRPIVSLLNRNIAETTAARELCAQLSGTVIAVRVTNTALAAYLLIEDDAIALATASKTEPDVVVSGSLLTLARMTGPASEELLREGALDMSGDAETAQQFQRLLEFAAPDLEDELSRVVGDVAAHHVGSFVRGVGRWGRRAQDTMTANVREYLQEESRDAPSRYEVERFQGEISTLRNDVARAEARLNRLLNDR